MSTTEEELTTDDVAEADVAELAADEPVESAEADDDRRYAVFVPNTYEGEQLLKPRSETTARELMREVGSVLRMSEAEAAMLGDLPEDPEEDQTMIINMGPQHPSTHGVLRLMLELQGEEVLRCKPIIGYLHTGMEKTAESLTYLQGGTNVTRMDYLSPFNNELVFSMATEALLGITDEIPERATWIRMLLSEMNRIASHLLFMATNGMDLGAVSMMIYGWREREEVLRFFQEVTGLRMNHNFIRPGGVAADLPPGWRDGVLQLMDMLPPRLDEYDTLMTGQPIWRERLQGVGVITPKEALALGATGPILRSTGVPWDLRHDLPYLEYEKLEFDTVVGSYGDAFDRYAIRLAEIRESMSLVHQILDHMPSGDYRIQDKKVTPPPRARIDESMEALIHHFKIFTEGFKVPEGEVYVGIEGPRGETGCYIASDGGPTPYRMHMRDPSFTNIQCLPHMMRGGLVADAVAVISSVDPVLGGVDR
ncbi:MAG: NADH-quinone oxidoreductase subunit D [Actinomycetota bacterium]